MSMDILPVVAMNLGMLCQNFAEWQGGGPALPSRIKQIAPRLATTPKTKAIAVTLISVLVPAISVLALKYDHSWLIAMTAAALVGNAIAQMATSMELRTRQPGTRTGLLVMLPTALWALIASDFSGGWAALVAGPVLSVPVLVLVWCIASRLAA